MLRNVVATPAGFEPATHSLEGCCSIRLSYGVDSGSADTRTMPDRCQWVHWPTRLNLKLSEYDMPLRAVDAVAGSRT